MRIVYLDCFSGISGDMTLGALLGLGADEQEFRRQLALLGVGGYELTIARRKVEGLMSVDVDVLLTEVDTGHGRHLSDIHEIYAASSLPARVIERATAIFENLAEAEAKVHGTTKEEIHFHEVGAVDAIVDITGTCILLEMLNVDAVYCSPLPYSRGFVDCQHGRMPLPAPATLELMAGIATYPVDVRGELVTPTGCAIVATLAGPANIGNAPAMTPIATGWGAGKKNFGTEYPNLLRAVLAEIPGKSPKAGSNGASHDVVVIETNVDDISAEILGHAQEALLGAGALDGTMHAVQMKKNRPGTAITVLSEPSREADILKVLFRETGTLGVRRRVSERVTLERSFAYVQTPFGMLAIKQGFLDGELVQAAPEFEQCRSAALAAGVAVRDVYQAGMAAWDAVTGR